MRSRCFLAPVIACLVAANAVAFGTIGSSIADIYSFDKMHTNITFSWDHLGLSRQSGRMLDCDGIVTFDPAAPDQAQVDVAMRVASLWTGVPALDKHLKSSDFFDAERHPLMTFRSTNARKTGQKTGEVSGELSILGIAKPVTLQLTWNYTGEHPLGRINANYAGKIVSGFTATAKLKRSEWGMDRAIPLASDDIEITINTELLKK